MTTNNTSTAIQTRRVYADPDGSAADDGFRIFVDRLWPRGESKEKFHYDLWAKDIAPSAELREKFHHTPAESFAAFTEAYRAELDANPATPGLIGIVRSHPLVTLLYGSRDELHNNAVVLADYLRSHI